MATQEQSKRRRSLLAILLALIGAMALCVIAWAAGWVSSPLLGSWFGGGAGETTVNADGDGDGSSGSGSCFLNVICFGASGSGEGVGGNADVTPPAP